VAALILGIVDEIFLLMAVINLKHEGVQAPIDG